MQYSESQFHQTKQTLQKKGSLKVEILSGSMEPLIQTRETLTVRPLQRPPRLFDILVFWSGKIYICHYVSYVNKLTWNDSEKRISTRSLQGPREDFPFPESNVLGVVEGKTLPIRYKILFFWNRFRNGGF